MVCHRFSIVAIVIIGDLRSWDSGAFVDLVREWGYGSEFPKGI